MCKLIDNFHGNGQCCKDKVESIAQSSIKNQSCDADTGHPLEMTCSVLKKPEVDTNTVRRIVGLVISV